MNITTSLCKCLPPQCSRMRSCSAMLLSKTWRVLPRELPKVLMSWFVMQLERERERAFGTSLEATHWRLCTPFTLGRLNPASPCILWHFWLHATRGLIEKAFRTFSQVMHETTPFTLQQCNTWEIRLLPVGGHQWFRSYNRYLFGELLMQSQSIASGAASQQFYFRTRLLWCHVKFLSV